MAAYRFGHTMIPDPLKVNDEFVVNGESRIPLFKAAQAGQADPDDLSGGRRAPRRYVDMNYFFHTSEAKSQPSKVIDTTMSDSLFDLPQGVIQRGSDDRRNSLAVRNLLRGHAFGLPSGQSVARAMSVPVVPPEAFPDIGNELACFREETPLWFYILQEGAVMGGGRHLGPVGGRIVAEVLVGLLEGDRQSFVFSWPEWVPDLPPHHNFRMVNLLEYAGVL